MSRINCLGRLFQLATFAIAVVALAGAGLVQLAADDKEDRRDDARERSATIKDNVIRLNPSGSTIQIPKNWVRGLAGFRNNLHLTRAELEKVETANGEWDKEYAEIVNRLLPFAHCAAHVGSEGWGREGVSYHDLQLRAYVTDAGAEKVQARLFENGKAWASKFSEKVSVSREPSGKWRRASLSYDMWYGDYGGKAIVDVYAQSIGMETVVLVFMHTDVRSASDLVPEILKSFNSKP